MKHALPSFDLTRSIMKFTYRQVLLNTKQANIPSDVLDSIDTSSVNISRCLYQNKVTFFQTYLVMYPFYNSKVMTSPTVWRVSPKMEVKSIKSFNDQAVAMVEHLNSQPVRIDDFDIVWDSIGGHDILTLLMKPTTAFSKTTGMPLDGVVVFKIDISNKDLGSSYSPDFWISKFTEIMNEMFNNSVPESLTGILIEDSLERRGI